nr:alpha-N-acetylneuraminide alpha-2,8-sialyltransferase-like [Lytechinus pictus]
MAVLRECRCFEVLDYENLNATEPPRNESLDQAPNKESHLLKSIKGVTIESNGSLLGKIWNFKDVDDQLLYLYEQLLKKDWKANKVNADTLSTRTDPINLPNGKRYRSCAVVGNSGSLRNSGCGKNIDKHDYVIRCNMAPLKPFKVDAGMKNNYVSMNPSILRTRFRDLLSAKSHKAFNAEVSKYSGILSIPCFCTGVSLARSMKAMSVVKSKRPQMTCMNPAHFISLSKLWGAAGSLHSRHSTGFYFVSMAIQICDEVDLYGFWPFFSRFGNQKTDVRYHYFDKMKHASKIHSMNEEFAILVQLHNLGIVKLNIGSC